MHNVLKFSITISFSYHKFKDKYETKIYAKVCKFCKYDYFCGRHRTINVLV